MDRQRRRAKMKASRYLLTACSILLILAGSYLVLSSDIGTTVKIPLLLVFMFSGLINLCYYLWFRKRFIRFTDTVCDCTEAILKGNSKPALHNQETLTSKMVMELEKISDILQYKLETSESEKAEVQKTISEITHQLITPIANIRMYQEMISDPDHDEADTAHFTQIILGQLEKLEFLIQSLIKVSRLEGEMIQLHPENTNIFPTLTRAVNGIIQKADQKKIEISIDCRRSIQALHDPGWTSEALETILDNAVKYTPAGGNINVSVSTGEMFTEIKVSDSGIGIAPEHINDIFKRFYRGNPAQTEGLGLGLYLSRKILSHQGGYISVRSAPGRGSCFTVFLPNYPSAS